MLYLKNALGGLGRSVTDTARHALAGADGAARWRKLALYLVMFALPGGSIVVLLLLWADRRRAQRTRVSVKPDALSSSGVQPCTGGQPACRAASPSVGPLVRPPVRLPARRLALHPPRSNDA